MGNQTIHAGSEKSTNAVHKCSLHSKDFLELVDYYLFIWAMLIPGKSKFMFLSNREIWPKLYRLISFIACA